MVAATGQKVEVSWDQFIDGNLPENPTRKAWREAVAEIAERAKVALPEANGRIDAAVKIVLAGDVEPLGDDTAKVASQSNGQTIYHIVNGACDCKDFPKAPQGFCQHRLGAAIYKRTTTLMKQRLEAQLDGDGNGHQATAQPAEVPKAEAQVTSPLPEAPASCNVYVTLAGRKVQLTLRDSDEQHLLARLETLLQRFPSEAETEQEPPEGWCAKHDAQMRKRQWGGYSHKTADGWCHGK